MIMPNGLGSCRLRLAQSRSATFFGREGCYYAMATYHAMNRRTSERDVKGKLSDHPCNAISPMLYIIHTYIHPPTHNYRKCYCKTIGIGTCPPFVIKGGAVCWKTPHMVSRQFRIASYHRVPSSRQLRRRHVTYMLPSFFPSTSSSLVTPYIRYLFHMIQNQHKLFQAACNTDRTRSLSR